MAADFPTNVVNLPNKSDGEKLYAVEYNKIVDEITAIETELKKSAADTIVQAADSAKLGGVAPSGYLGASAQAADSAKLGGQLPSAFLGATSKAADSNLLDGYDSAAFWLKTEAVNSPANLMEAGQRVFSPNNPQVVALATPAVLISGSLAVDQTVDINVTSHGVPAGTRFVLLQLDMAWGAANGLITVSRGQTAENDIIVRAPAANVQTAQGIVKCRVTNNLIRFVNKNAATTNAYIRMFGYEM